MTWICKYDVVVPSYEVTNGKVLFAIKFIKNDACSSTQNEIGTTLRSYSQFRCLWTTLLGIDLSNQAGATRDRHFFLSFSAKKCRCSIDRCEFEALDPLMKSISFPSRQLLRSKLTGLDHITVIRRRDQFGTLLALLHKFFASFSTSTLRNKLQHNSCLVLKTYANFVGAPELFPVTPFMMLHLPLALNKWRQQCAEHILVQGVQHQSKTASDITTRDRENNEKKAGPEQDILPFLQIQTVRVHTMQSFIEEFCEHVLSEFAGDINELNRHEVTEARRWEICLYVACRIGHTYAVQLILFNYANANTAMADGTTCLQIAARMGRIDIVGLLLDEGADVNKANDAGVTPLIAACRNGCIEIVKLLLEAGAIVSLCSNRGTYPLHAAIVSQSLEIVSMLVDRGANVNVMTTSGITPLHFAAKLGSLAISEYLLRHDAHPEKRTKGDTDAMMIAMAHGHTTICELFQRFSVVRSDFTSETDKISDMLACSPYECITVDYM